MKVNMANFVWVLFLSACMTSTYGQSIIADYSFENCTVTDNTGNFTNNFVRNNIDCECGVDGPPSRSLIFDGSPDTIFLDPGLKDVFLSDFSMSFHFWVDDAMDEYPLFSIRSECSRDSSFIIRYLPFSEDIEVEFTANALDGMFLRTDVNPDICWHHFLLTRSGGTFNFYLDGEFIATYEEFTTLALGVDHQFTVGYSPCIDASNPNSDVFFRGRLDNLQFFDFAIPEVDIDNLLVFPDQIITSDTTIFMGDAIDIISGPTCAPNIIWTPSTDLSDTSSASPEAFPETTTNYMVEYDHGSCVSSDMIRISVIDTEQIDCGNIIFPTAFTPNDDDINDEFYISNAFIIENLIRFEIYDRWGLLLYSSINKNERWNGTYNGTRMPSGVYVYKIEYDCGGDNYQKTGSFNILK
jgi:gliding motility-associated-like protein